MRISDWSSDVCSSDLLEPVVGLGLLEIGLMSLDFEKGDHSGFILPSAIERVGAHEPCRRQPLDPCDLELKIADPIIRFEKTEIAALVRTLRVFQRARLHAQTDCSTGAAVPIRKADAPRLKRQ